MLKCISVPSIKLTYEQMQQIKESLCDTKKCGKDRRRDRVQIEPDSEGECEAPYHKTPEPRQPIYKQAILSAVGRSLW